MLVKAMGLSGNWEENAVDVIINDIRMEVIEIYWYVKIDALNGG